jgi:hypothetical protein
MTPALFLAIAAPLLLVLHVLHQLTRRTPPDLDLPDTWRPHPRTVVHTHHLERGRSW